MAVLESVVNNVGKYINDLAVAYATATTLTVGTGKCRDSTDQMEIEVASALTISSAAAGINGLDTGTIANNTWYAVHVIADSTLYNDVAAMISTSSTAPTLPYGYSAFRQVGWALTNGSAQFLAWNQTGNQGTRKFQWATPISVLSAGAQTSFTAVSLAGAVPGIAVPVKFNAAYTPNSATNTAQLRPTGSSVAEDSVPVILGAGVAAAQKFPPFEMLVLTSSGNASIDYLVQSSDALTLTVQGFEFYV